MKQTEPTSVSKMLLTETAEPSNEAIIVPSSSSVDITDVSRMGFDLRRNAMVGDRNKVDPEEADKRFVQLLVKLLQKVCMLLCALVLIPGRPHTAMTALQAASCDRRCHYNCNELHSGYGPHYKARRQKASGGNCNELHSVREFSTVF